VVVVSHSLGIPREKEPLPGNSQGVVVVLSVRLKGVLIMTAVPFTLCCSMLAVDAKTLRQWLKHSHLSLHQSPTDARVKCLTIEQVHHLAILHGRSIQQDASAVPLVLPEKPAPMPLESLMIPNVPNTLPATAELVDKLSSLEATVTILQQQVTHLALELLHERERTFEHRLRTLEAFVQQTLEPSLCQQEVKESAMSGPSAEPSSPGRCPNPGELRGRSRLVSLIEYGAHGSYVIISPQEGELSFTPDSQEWFEWLASLSSFRFVGQLGRFSAARENRRGQPTRQWAAVRGKQNRTYKSYLGVTDRLTISRLEQVAAKLQSHMTSL